jgi:outer membrane murein-binding lipoprotein Lpp
MKATVMKTAAVVLGVGLLAGCASSDKLTKMEADIANAQATADAAMKAAKQAQLDAASAQGTADSALSAANAAQATADEANERVSRMAEKAMAK